jgi:thioredoxin-related protein
MLAGGAIIVLAARSIFGFAEAEDFPADELITARGSVSAIRARDTHGAIVPLVTPHEPAIVMISSVTCGWCRRAMRDVAKIAGDRDVPGLKLLTLEGASGGESMLADAGVRGATLLGPAGDADQVLLTFRYPGTPTFVVVDSSGAVVKTIPGYPGYEGMRRMIEVILEKDSATSDIDIDLHNLQSTPRR